MIERTLVILKPDAYEQNLVTFIQGRIAALGLDLVNQAFYLHLPAGFVKRHYAAHADKPYFPRILAYMTRGICGVILWEGEDAITKVRTLAGATRPDQADPASLRGRFGRITPDGGIENIIHASTSTEEAQTEIDIFFPDA